MGNLSFRIIDPNSQEYEAIKKKFKPVVEQEALKRDVRNHPDYAELDSESQEYVMDISKAIKENALDMCMTTEEAWNAATAIEDDPDLLNQGLTDAQRLHCLLYTSPSPRDRG